MWDREACDECLENNMKYLKIHLVKYLKFDEDKK